MPKPYSYDFRQKVIQAIELDGFKKQEASELFNISRNTINLWLKRKAETGDVQALPNHPPGNNHKITDWEQFRAFAKTHGDKTQVEMAQLWEGDNPLLSNWGETLIFRRLKQRNFVEFSQSDKRGILAAQQVKSNGTDLSEK